MSIPTLVCHFCLRHCSIDFSSYISVQLCGNIQSTALNTVGQSGGCCCCNANRISIAGVAQLVPFYRSRACDDLLALGLDPVPGRQL